MWDRPRKKSNPKKITDVERGYARHNLPLIQRSPSTQLHRFKDTKPTSRMIYMNFVEVLMLLFCRQHKMLNTLNVFRTIVHKKRCFAQSIVIDFNLNSLKINDLDFISNKKLAIESILCVCIFYSKRF